MTFRKSATAAATAALLAIGYAAPSTVVLAQDAQPAQPRHTAEEIKNAKPSGTIEFESEQFRLLLGGGSGKGTLLYKGKKYPFTMKAVSAGGVGYTKSTGTGTVYFLDKVEDFPGTYSAATAGFAVGAGAGAANFENGKGVFLSVRSKTEGAALNLGLGGVAVEFVK